MTPDRFTQWLLVSPAAPQPSLYQPGAFLGAPPLGWKISLGRTHFVYRVPADAADVFYIVRIERAVGRTALHSPFLDLVRLLHLVQTSDCGIRWIRGHVEPVKDRPTDALSRERILAFYQRYLTAVHDGVENGIAWYGGDLTTFSWQSEKRKVRLTPPRLT